MKDMDYKVAHSSNTPSYVSQNQEKHHHIRNNSLHTGQRLETSLAARLRAIRKITLTGWP